MDYTHHLLTIGSYNCQHFQDDKVQYLKSLIAENGILFLQEHWLLQSQFMDFYKIGDISYHAVSAMDDSKPLIGRPHGGCCIAWRNSLKVKFDPISCSNCRLCAGIMTLDNGLKLLLVNVYLPCDDRYQSAGYNETIDILNEVSSLICDHETDIIVVAGDFNTDLIRSTPQVKAMKNFIDAAQLKNCLNFNHAKVDYTYESKSNGALSIIDHILISDNIFRDILEVKTTNNVDNMSDHVAITCKLDINVTMMKKGDRIYQPKAAWYKAEKIDITEYKNNLDLGLSKIHIPMDLQHCDNVFCELHQEQITTLLSDIVQACLCAENNCIPKTGSRSKRVAGWNDLVKGDRQEALYWHHEWDKLSRPKTGDTYQKMKQTRKVYHKSVQLCKKNDSVLKSQKLAEAMMKNKNRNFWDEVKRLNKSSKTVSSYIDGEGDSNEIANIFHEKFSGVYRSVPHNNEMMCQVKERINEKVQQDLEVLHHDGFCIMDIKKAIFRLKSGKADGNMGLSSDCILNGTNRLYVLLSLFFRIILIHGFVPETLLLGTMTPIPKSKSLQSSDNYRAITLISSILKVFDYNILMKFERQLQTDSLQLRFKSFVMFYYLMFLTDDESCQSL